MSYKRQMKEEDVDDEEVEEAFNFDDDDEGNF